MPISTGLAVALNVLPAPSFSSRKCLPFSKSGSKPNSLLNLAARVRLAGDGRQLENRLRVVGHRAVRIDGDRHRPHAEEAERHEAEREHRRGEHQLLQSRRRTELPRRRRCPSEPTITSPIQNALKLPAVRPERILSDAPPSRDDATTSFTCCEFVDVKIFTSSGMIAPASVPHVMIVASFHHSVPSPRSRISSHGSDVRHHHGNDRRQPHERRERLFEIHLVRLLVLRLGGPFVDDVRQRCS